MMQIQSPTFNPVSWETGGVLLTGNPIVADAGDPNTFAPSNSRIVSPQYVIARQTYVYFNALASMQAVIVGGTSVLCRMWFFDNALNKWVQFGPDLTHATAGQASIAENFNSVLMMTPGVRWFVQIVTVTGAVTAFGYMFN